MDIGIGIGFPTNTMCKQIYVTDCISSFPTTSLVLFTRFPSNEKNE